MTVTKFKTYIQQMSVTQKLFVLIAFLIGLLCSDITPILSKLVEYVLRLLLI